MQKLIAIVAQLRSPEGCPWDRKQTHQTLVPFLLEEAWEVIDEIKNQRWGDELKDELGDLLLQVVLHAQIAKEEQRFTIEEVIDTISAKMIDRHPHVFGETDQQVTAEEQKQLWHQRKIKEKKQQSLLDGISPDVPALISALKISQRASSTGFDWESPWQVLDKIKEELEEVKAEMVSEDMDRLEDEIGDLLFSITNLARFYKINPEVALKRGNDKFKKRFLKVEKAINKATDEGIRLSPEEMDKIWNESKKNIP